ncbi:MAG TPA: SDR family NAD(P)-dependent oxidoreductase [Acidimicrobiales bacterium]|jgi:NAD(P)-dependent dehydrogenase (short-subunit alcohol dehydrogenase family)
MAGPLAGRGAVVTGGTRGIGRAVADRLAAEGARVGVLDLDLDPGSPHAGWQADVADAAAVSAAIAEAADRFGGLAILVNNAGVGTAKALHRYGDDEWARLVGVNLTGAWHAMRAALPHLRTSGAGSIVSIAGTTASRPTRGEGPYAAAKAGLVALTKTAAVEYAPEVRVNAVSPGYIATRLTRAVVEDEKLRARVEGRIPLGRIGTVDDVAGVVAFLCGPDAAYVTGQDIIVDGGSILPSHQSDDLLKALLSREEP